MLSYSDMIRECVVPRKQYNYEIANSYRLGYIDGINRVIEKLQEDYALPQEVLDKLNNLK